ncbi:MAG: hypothetical protein PHT07_01870 [Paludibacter sp.]|nr:hypothetical protein [Paludibacter sp.]
MINTYSVQTSRNKYNLAFTPLILAALVCIIALSSCTQYQYITLNSNLEKNKNNEFSIDNDTVSIKYNFSGENFVLSQTIFNKLEIPLYIDWDRTNVIVNGSDMLDSFYVEQQINYIAPKSQVTIVSNSLLYQFIDIKQLELIPKVGVNKGKNVDWTSLTFDKETTPVYLRNRIALTTHEDFTDPFYLNNSFWFSEILQNMTSPGFDTRNRSNQFYIRRTTGFGGFMNGVSAIAVVAILVLADTKEVDQ